jgi:hypothetical protein
MESDDCEAGVLHRCEEEIGPSPLNVFKDVLVEEARQGPDGPLFVVLVGP